MERKIGEIFEYNGEWYQCVGGTCRNCSFYYDTVCKNITTIGSTNFGNCHCSLRTDHKSVIFKKLEKVGEPFPCNYYGDDRLIIMQEYRVYENRIISPEGVQMYITDEKHKRVAIAIKQNQEDMEEKTQLPKEDNALTRLVYNYANGKISDKELIESIKGLSDKYPYAPKSKKFDLKAAKAGKPVCTRDGCKARIICFDAKDDRSIIALVESKIEGKEILVFYLDNGFYFEREESQDDLMMLPEKKEGWVNVYKGGLLDTKSYNTRKEAFDKACPKDYVDTVKISWEE